MPVKKCSNDKYRIGSGKCRYKTKKSAEKSYKGYLVSKYSEAIKYYIKERINNYIELLKSIDNKNKK